MAYLNVRERRIEAKIAYVGPDLAGKSANFDWLRKTKDDARIGRIASASDAGDILSIAWQPPERARFRDCDVLVKVVAHGGETARRRFDGVFSDVDGIVLVVDAHPAAQPRNKDSLVTVRDALERAERHGVPVVVQVNKTDLPDALSASDVVSAMDAGAFPHVAASAVRGDGVVDTLEAALNQVLASMQREGGLSDASPTAQKLPVPEAPGRGPADSGHPLLAALRQVLRDTVREHVEDLEGRLVARLEASLDRIAQSQARGEASGGDMPKVLSDLGDLVMELSYRTVALTDRS